MCLVERTTFVCPAEGVRVPPLLAVATVNDAAALCDHLDDVPSVVHAVHAFAPGADGVERRDGEEALNVVRSRLGARATVRLHRPEGAVVEGVAAVASEVGAGEVLVGADGATARALRERGLEVVVAQAR
jgi:hypothetical protein